MTSPSSHAGFWKITSVEPDRLTIADFDEQLEKPGDDSYTQEAQWCLPRTAKVFDLEEGTLKRWDPTPKDDEIAADTIKGTVPHGCKIITTWQDRLILANDQVDPHMWYMSRNGDA